MTGAKKQNKRLKKAQHCMRNDTELKHRPNNYV